MTINSSIPADQRLFPLIIENRYVSHRHKNDFRSICDVHWMQVCDASGKNNERYGMVVGIVLPCRHVYVYGGFAGPEYRQTERILAWHV
jgi:hypothetical protein